MAASFPISVGVEVHEPELSQSSVEPPVKKDFAGSASDSKTSQSEKMGLVKSGDVGSATFKRHSLSEERS